MELQIAFKSDLEEILTLQKLCYREEAELYNDYQIAPLTENIENIFEDFEKIHIYKTQIESKIIGSVRISEDKGTGKKGRLIVHPAFRNKGIASQIMKDLESKHKHLQRFELFTGHKSERNLNLYGKLGFKEFKRQAAHENLELVFLEKVNLL